MIFPKCSYYYFLLQYSPGGVIYKQQAKNFDEDVLRAKADSFMKAVGPFKDYDIIYQGLSIENM